MSDLRERVAREIYEIPVFGVSGVGFPAWNDVTHEIREHYLNMAHAAVALVLEEAHLFLWSNGDFDQAIAIRALKEKSDE